MAAVNASRSLTTLARCLLALALSLAAVAAPAAPVEWLPAPVARQLRAAGVAPRHAALVVQEVGSPLPRVSVNAQAPMSPASVMKLVTTYAALDMLGPAYTWRTQVLAAGHYRLKSRAHGYLSLAVADITAKQAVHRLRPLHILLDLLCCLCLVR